MAEDRATLEGSRKKWGPGISLEDSTLQTSDKTEYVRFKTLEYRIDNLQDDDLWEDLKDSKLKRLRIASRLISANSGYVELCMCTIVIINRLNF
jgi:hypothetical protein